MITFWWRSGVFGDHSGFTVTLTLEDKT